ncbi:MAG: succinylglutamate desuccinylase/aspartoacylase family protein, partial [Armatimonadota bacterium]|nr:succinylglutamate desuccinylase/aspartoacylase family protein [Armatimonadota bacterium]
MRCLLLICLLLLPPALAFGSPEARTDASPVTSYAQMTAQLRADAARSPLLRLVSLGKSAKGKKDLWLVRVADPDVDPVQTTRLLVLCRQHGDEPASTEAVLRLIHQTARGSDPVLAKALSQVTIYLVPMLNPDGADANTRANGAGVDLNRDWGVFSQPETRLAARAAALIQPHIVLDAHNWDGGDHYNANCLEIARAM